MGENLLTKTNKRLSIFFILLFFFLLLILLNFNFPCIFKEIFSLSCPGCGLTRSIFALLSFDFKTSLYYNILGIPLFIILVITYLLIIVDIIKKENYLTSFWLFLIKKYKIIVLLVILSFIINNIHNI